MDETSHLTRIRSSPDNLGFLREYADWLTANGDVRGEYLETELAFREAEARIEELRGRMYELTVIRKLDLVWLDVVHPLFVTSPAGGKFQSAHSPEDRPLVCVGAPVEPDTIVGVLEIGSVPNEVVAGHAGYVSEIFVTSGQYVSNGERLMCIVRVPPVRTAKHAN